MSASTSHNFIVAYRYFSKRDISFVKFDDALLLMNFALANLDHHTDVRRWDGSFEPLININERSYQEALKRAKAMLRTAMVNHDVTEVITPKNASNGNSALNEATKLVVQAQLDGLLQLIKDSEETGSKERIGTRFTLSRNDFLSDEFQVMLKDF